MVSIKDVARQAGVAISTVSKVLNSYPNVSDETRGRVNKAVEELNFLPNSVAAALSSKKAGRVALLVNINAKTQASDEISLQYIQGAINKAMELNLDVITLFFSMLEDKEPQEVINYLKAQNVEGIIIYRMSRQDRLIQEVIESGSFKAVVMSAPFWNENTSSVCIDQKRAQYDVVKKTIEENEHCRRVLYIAGSRGSFVTEARIAGVEQLAEEMGLDLTIEYGNFSEKRARELTFSYADKKDVFACASDLMAIGSMRALMELDVFHPVCGFDGITLMGYAGKQMNTVRQDFYRMSANAMEELYGLMHGEKGRLLVPEYELVRIRYQDVLNGMTHYI